MCCHDPISLPERPLCPPEPRHVVETCPSCKSKVYALEVPWAQCEDCKQVVCCASELEAASGVRVLCPRCIAAYEKCDSCGDLAADLEEVEDRDDSVGYHSEAFLCGQCRNPRSVAALYREAYGDIHAERFGAREVVHAG